MLVYMSHMQGMMSQRDRYQRMLADQRHAFAAFRVEARAAQSVLQEELDGAKDRAARLAADVLAQQSARDSLESKLEDTQVGTTYRYDFN